MTEPQPNILPFPGVAARNPARIEGAEDPIVITGIGIGASLGASREEVWQGIQSGRSGVRLTRNSDRIGSLRLPCGMVDWLDDDPYSLKSIRITEHVSAEALADADLPWQSLDRNRFACSLSAQFGDIGYMYLPADSRDAQPLRSDGHRWWDQFLPCSVSTIISEQFDLRGPRLCHTTACASGLISTIAAARMIQDDQADFALCGAADTVAEMVIAAFNRLGVLSPGPDPASACRPFDTARNGFVMGEGAAMLVLEKRSTAIARGAKIYAELAAFQTLCQAHHVTGLDGEAETLIHLLKQLTRKAGWEEIGPQYINAHGTGTEQNDRSELTGVRAAFGDRADDILMSSNKGVLGHLVNAAGSIELALTAMALRDGYAPPTMHLTSPEATGNIDCLAEWGEHFELDRALKLSLAFGGHLVGVALQRCPLAEHRRPSQPLIEQARVRGRKSAPLRRVA
ncbi:MAG: beta-ketoacyl-[acyl-carrier-protein] synthase family protein [Pirellulaceae bacterium]|jgi:3-oxoacyl-(acyl-carrier-protein) synthase|nr:beta-ketoacyl-[acyl-carrier-protein] synthase family protein [Pirellulaceae bacterium]